MRFDLKKSFGHPVLRKNSSDYVDADISTSIELLPTEESSNLHEIEYHVMIGVREIKDSIIKRDLMLVVNFFCPRTLYSETFLTSDLTGRRVMDMRNIRGDLHINVEIIVNQPQFTLKSSKFHPEFMSISDSYELKKGDLVAQAWPEKLFIEREVFKSVTSLFEWTTNDDIPDGIWNMGITNDSIKIEANSSQKNILLKASVLSNGKGILLNSIFMPAMVSLISQAIAEECDETDLWYQVLVAKLNAMGEVITSNSNPIMLAQKLLKNPLSALNKTIQMEE
jgi:hypothetical protein